jgi:type II secretory pathway component PulF
MDDPVDAEGAPPLAGYRLVVGAWALAVVAALFFALVPTYSGESVTVDSSGHEVTSHSSSTLVEENGAGILGLISWPAVVATLPLVMRRRRWPRLAALLLMLPVVALVFSIGPFYAPVALLLLLSFVATGSADEPVA